MSFSKNLSSVANSKCKNPNKYKNKNKTVKMEVEKVSFIEKVNVIKLRK